MDLSVLLAPGVGLIVGIAVRASPGSVGTVFAGLWFAAVLSDAAVPEPHETWTTTVETCALMLLGSSAAFIAGFASYGLVRNRRRRRRLA